MLLMLYINAINIMPNKKGFQNINNYYSHYVYPGRYCM